MSNLTPFADVEDKGNLKASIVICICLVALFFLFLWTSPTPISAQQKDRVTTLVTALGDAADERPREVIAAYEQTMRAAVGNGTFTAQQALNFTAAWAKAAGIQVDEFTTNDVTKRQKLYERLVAAGVDETEAKTFAKNATFVEPEPEL